jgi:hypothetical protein
MVPLYAEKPRLIAGALLNGSSFKWLSSLSGRAPQSLFACLGQSAERGLTALGAQENGLRDTLANVVLFAGRRLAANTVERDFHVRQSANVKAVFHQHRTPL